MPIARRRVVMLGSTALLLPSASRAQSTWPGGPVTVVVGYTPGGSTDINARELAHVMSPKIGQQIVIDNKGGANGSIGVRAVASAKPDGYTIFFGNETNVAINPYIQKGMIDTLTSLAPICQTTAYQHVLVVSPKGPVNTPADLVALARKEPGKLTFSSPGVGSSAHLAAALFAQATGTQLTHVPYKGTAPALADVISGQITMTFSTLPPAVSQIRGGNLKALAVTGEKRVTALPDIATLGEQGISVVMINWQGMFAPGRTPAAILDEIEKSAKQAMADPKWAEALARNGVEPAPERTRAQFTKMVADEHAFWGKNLKALKIEME